MNPSASSPPAPGLPSRRICAILATGMLVAGIALGAAIGPGTAASLASSARAAAVARVLALVALNGTGAGGGMLLAASAGQPASAGHTQAPTVRRATHNIAGSVATSKAGAGSPGSSAGGGPSETPAQNGQPSTLSPSRRGSGDHPNAGAAPGGSEGNEKPVRLAPIAHVWLIVLPYGQSFASVLAQSSAAPYLTGQLLGEGTLLSGYSSLAAGELASAATLLSGAVAAGVSTIAPACASAQGGAAGETQCAASEPAGAQAADAFLQAVVPQIVATTAYREGGLIAITFAAEESAPAAPAGSPTPASGAAPASGPAPAGGPAPASDAAPAISYPTGTQTSTLTASGTAGALLLSPFLRRPGARVASAFDAPAPRASLQELLRDPSKTVRR